ncbi:MAG: polyphosphate polymerase domain-containing protein [Clostridia bacterium]|nr:polyphosphate polymerase domain-containing protein [Clostridia bacterium]
MLRNEIKYLLTYEDYVILSRRMAAILTLDKHTVSPDGYRITSLYLDDKNDTSYYEKLSGDTNRKKYRIRAYNYNSSVISLECKEKKQSKINKTSIRIDHNTFNKILVNDFRPLSDINNDLARTVFALNREKQLKPSVVVDYVREAYTHPLSNTRITFDKELACGINTNDFFDEDYKSGYIFPHNEVILEVKFDEYLPTMIRQMLSIGYRPLAASKYMLCRDYLKSHSIIINNTQVGGQKV